MLDPMLNLKFRICSVLEVGHETIVAGQCVVHSLMLCKVERVEIYTLCLFKDTGLK